MSQMTMIQAINSALDVMLEKDPAVILLGQDIGYFGGVFRCTEGLQEKYGEHRVIDAPIAEGGIVGAAIGLRLSRAGIAGHEPKRLATELGMTADELDDERVAGPQAAGRQLEAPQLRPVGREREDDALPPRPAQGCRHAKIGRRTSAHSSISVTMTPASLNCSHVSSRSWRQRSSNSAVGLGHMT